MAFSYVSVCMGSRVCVSLQRQPSFKERNNDAYNYFLQSAIRVEIFPRRQKTKIKYLSLKKSNPISLAVRTAYLPACMRTESVFALKALLGIQHWWGQREKGNERLHHTHL